MLLGKQKFSKIFLSGDNLCVSVAVTFSCVSFNMLLLIAFLGDILYILRLLVISAEDEICIEFIGYRLFKLLLKPVFYLFWNKIIDASSQNL